MSSFSLQQFYRFCRSLKIDAKETGVTTMKSLLGTQRYFMDEVGKALEEGKHYIVCLKARQLGISTICLALDLYWHFRHRGLGGTLITHDEPSRDQFRTQLQMYYDSLPLTHKFPLKSHNRNQMVFSNQSRLMYQIASSRASGKLGRGKAITFLHATEVSSWGDIEGLKSMLASLAEKNPARLFIFESTARGYNHYFDMWEEAKNATTQAAIFVPWWMNELYSVPDDSNEFRTYWDGSLEDREREWAKDVKRMYDYTLTPNQMAWWRWKLNEQMGDYDYMLQEFSPTENFAFMLTGSQFFPSARLNEMIHLARQKKPQHYRMQFGLRFEDTKLLACGPEFSNLRIWDDPIPDASRKGVFYVLGADPAYGASDWADSFCITVWRCFADGMDQVAEFCTPLCTTAQFAWAICYLAGVYDNTLVNLEVTGPGQATLAELENMRRTSFISSSPGSRGMYDVVKNIQYYIYRRLDSTSGGGGFLHTQTTHGVKERMMNGMKDLFTRGMMNIYSIEMLEEMKTVIRGDGGTLGAEGRNKDDRVLASALAVMPWMDRLRLRLAQANVTRSNAVKPPTGTGGINPVESYLKRVGLASA